ncbi:hypothetical protein ACRJ4W_03170, partial [Streptomyces sp. GLT-R25]
MAQPVQRVTQRLRRQLGILLLHSRQQRIELLLRDDSLQLLRAQQHPPVLDGIQPHSIPAAGDQQIRVHLVQRHPQRVQPNITAVVQLLVLDPLRADRGTEPLPGYSVTAVVMVDAVVVDLHLAQSVLGPDTVDSPGARRQLPRHVDLQTERMRRKRQECLPRRGPR